VGIGALSGSLASGTGQVIVNLFTPNVAWHAGVPDAMLVGGVTGGIAGGVGYGIGRLFRPIVAPRGGPLVKYDPVFALEQGANSATVVPDNYAVVRGGQAPMPPPGATFSGSMGETVYDAATGVPHGTIRSTTAGAIRQQGGSVILAPEPTRSGAMNNIHVNVTEGGAVTVFGLPIPNPVPKSLRIN
jgi:hypothetical protein